MDRRTFVGTAVRGLLAVPLAANGQPQGKTARVGYLGWFPREADARTFDVFKTIVERLRELGYVEGRNLIVDLRYTDSEELSRTLAAELVGAGVHVIYAHGPYALRVARAATATVPIVGLDHETDPIAAGYAASLARPGGNVTGVFFDQSEVSAKQLQLLKETVPGLARVAVLWDPAVAMAQREAVDEGARRLGITVSPIDGRGPDTVPEMLRLAMQGGARGLIVLSSPRIYTQEYRPVIAAAALKNHLPAIGLLSTFPRAGLLMAYGPVQRDMLSSAANLIAKILDGGRPGDLPIERPIRFELVINLKTATALGTTIPQSLLQRADEVIQ
ncbi:MAG: ABC transporter substrate-binding protein [Burkholderiales bacterium]